MNKMADSVNSNVNKATKGVALLSAAVSGFAVKDGFTEAMNMQGYKAQLETAMKDTKKASEMMSWAVDMANRTPYEGGEIVNGAAKLESLGISAKKWLPMIGDMAGATGKNFDQATEAIIDAQMGEFERLKEFGLKKVMIQAQADKMFGKGKTVNARGQIKDQKKFNAALEVLMKDKYLGGMDRASKTLRGVLSTVTGVYKSSMSTILGITQTGDVQKGSIFEKLIAMTSKLAKKMADFQASGAAKKMSVQLGTAFQKVLDVTKKLYKFIKDNKEILILGAQMLFISLIFFRVISSLTKMVKAFVAFKKILTLISLALKVPLLTAGLVIVVIALIIASLALLYMRYKPFRDFVNNSAKKFMAFLISLMPKIKAFGSVVVDVFNSLILPALKYFGSYIITSFKSLMSGMKTIIFGLTTYFSGLILFLTGVFTQDWSKMWEGFKLMFQGTIDVLLGIFNLFKDGLLGTIKFLAGAIGGLWKKITGKATITAEVNENSTGASPKTGRNALGTQFWKGGQTTVGEYGPEIVDLPKGSKVHSNSQSKKMSSEKKSTPISIYIENLIGDDAMAERVSSIFCRKIASELANM